MSGVCFKSGRYPYGSGEHPHQAHSCGEFLAKIKELKNAGLSEVEIAKTFGMNTAQLRAQKHIARNEHRAYQRSLAIKLKGQGHSVRGIARRMNISDSTVRKLLSDSEQTKINSTQTIANALKANVGKDGLVDVGSGVEAQLGITRTKLNNALALLKDEGYSVHVLKVRQVNSDNYTNLKVLTPPGVDFKEASRRRAEIEPPNFFSKDRGRTVLGIKPPVEVDPSRILVRGKGTVGEKKDGTIELNPTAKDLTLNGAKYAQVRIAVGGGKYMKGMAIYGRPEDFPPGIDFIYNQSKRVDPKNPLGVLKPMKDDPDNPFGATIRQFNFTGEDGKTHLSPLNVVGGKAGAGFPGGWTDWSRALSSQILSKQPVSLAKEQLDAAYKKKVAEYEEIMSLTNPAIKKTFLEKFADGCDSAAVEMKGAALPRQANAVILPLLTIKPTEVYAPNLRDGESVVLFRHPHGGIFEAAPLIVNNKSPEGRRVIGNAIDAIGIHPKVAQKLSGADFDGDTVIIIPNNHGKLKTAPALLELKNFDPRESYPYREGIKLMTPNNKQTEMGKISNLITDMTIKGANEAEIARAVRHSMVVIDAEKHKLDYVRSYYEHGIPELKKKYQGGERRGASTLISRAGGEARVPQRGRSYITPTGEKRYVETGKTYVVDGKVHQRLTKVPQLLTRSSAHELSSGSPIEKVYADHSDKLRSLGRRARRSMLEVKSQSYVPSARKTYSEEVKSLRAKLRLAQANSPLERKAQLLANTIVWAKRRDNPHIDHEHIKKIGAQALEEARAIVGATRPAITFTPKEWTAIQSGAISSHFFTQLLRYVPDEHIKKLALPPRKQTMSVAKIQRAQAMLNAGKTWGEVSSALGVSITTIRDALNK